MKLLLSALFLFALLGGEAAAQPAQPAPASPPGLLVMAHGGTPAWNAAVEAAVAPLRARYRVAVAYGMADPGSLGEGLEALARQGAERVAVVRLFLDGRSFLHQTEYFLGLRPDPPAQFILHGDHGQHGSGHGSQHDGGTPAPVAHGLELALSAEGLMQAEEVGAILAARAEALSEAPAEESVLVLAHGTGDDRENARWIAAIEHLSGGLRALGFHAVRVETLREDWPEPRAAAERAIRSFVAAEAEAGRRVLVVPFRLAGFGPYREVLDGLSYRAAEAGILPHEAVTAWIERTYLAVAARKGWDVPTQ